MHDVKVARVHAGLKWGVEMGFVRFQRAECALLRALLRRVDPQALSRHELLLMVDLLSAALLAVEPPLESE